MSKLDKACWLAGNEARYQWRCHEESLSDSNNIYEGKTIATSLLMTHSSNTLSCEGGNLTPAIACILSSPHACQGHEGVQMLHFQHQQPQAREGLP